MTKVIVIGGGASGLTSAIYAARSGADVTILEKNSNCCKKILITGNGRCNYLNADMNTMHFNSSSGSIDNVITDNISEVSKLFKSIGIIPKIKNGYYYPMSNQAISVSNAPINEARLLNVDIKNNINVLDVLKTENGFIVKTDYEDYMCDKVVVATGSKAAPKTGSDGFGYQLLERLGHKIIKVLPALVQLKTNNHMTKLWDGVRSEAKVSLYINNEKIKEESGEVMLTDYGLSGICIFNLSSDAAKALDKNKDVRININLLNSIDNENKMGWFDELNLLVPNRSLSELLDNLLNYKLVNAILKSIKIDRDSSWDDLSVLEKELLIKNLFDFEVEITGTNSFDKAQVCSGGVDLSEIDLNTMESKIIKGLFVVGELLDVDGDCGGYNLTWAWLSGIIAGRSIND